MFVARCTILGGTNGSGKSSIFDNSPELQIVGDFINADQVARSISPDRPETVSGEAGRRVILELARLISAQQDFVLETTLSSKQSLRLMRAARDAGYLVGLVFVVLMNVDLNVRRVHERVSRGGHSIPDQVIHRRYRRALANLAEAIALSHETAIYDNSLPDLVKVAELSNKKLLYQRLNRANPSHIEVATAIALAIDTPVTAIFDAT